MISILVLLIRLALVAVFAFGFVVLFEHGPANYVDNAKRDFESLKSMVQK